MGAAAGSSGLFAITKTRLFLVVSVAITWWFAHLLPHYQPRIRAELNSRIQEARLKIPSIKVDWKPSDNPRDHYNSTKVALLIEPRPLPHLVPHILHMTSVVPPDWRFLFIGSDASVVSVGRSFAIKHQQIIGKLDLMVLPEPWEIDAKEKVYRLLTDMRFYDEFLPGIEWILKYESDSLLCSNSDSSLNDWLHWSWAGAPRSEEDRFSGNGGLSLRRVSAIKRVLRFQERYNDTDPEDEWFGTRLWVLPGAKVAAGSDGVLAVEDIYMEKPMGYHIREGGKKLSEHVWKSREQRKKIFEYCPELSLIMDMKLERERCEGDNGEGTVEIDPFHQPEGQEPVDDAARRKQEADEAEKKKQDEAATQKLIEEARRKQVDAAIGSSRTAPNPGDQDAPGASNPQTAPSPSQEKAADNGNPQTAPTPSKEEAAAVSGSQPPPAANKEAPPVTQGVPAPSTPRPGPGHGGSPRPKDAPA